MKLSIEQKYQIEYIKHPREMQILSSGEEYVFIWDGTAGAYIPRNGLMISLPEKLKLDENKYIMPEQLYNLSIEGELTEELKMDEDERIYRKVISDIGEVWVDIQDIKKFGKLAEYRVQENGGSVCVTINGVVKGVIQTRFL